MSGLKDHDVLGGEKGQVTHDELTHLTQLTPEERAIEKKLRRKIDGLIMPLIVAVYLMNYIDRNNYAAARLQGLEEDLGLVGNQYEVALSILFVGYILGQVPSNILLNYTGRPSKYIGFFTVAWGLVSALTSQVKNYRGIVVCRFFLGVVESPFFPGVLFYLSKWYTKSELALRMAIFYSGSLLSGAFGNLIAAGILRGLEGVRGLASWQWLYIIEGVITVFIGLIVMVVLPDFPHTWKALSPEEKHVANRRMAVEAAEADIDEAGMASQMKGLKMAFADPKTYVRKYHPVSLSSPKGVRQLSPSASKSKNILLTGIFLHTVVALGYMGVTGAAGFQNFFPTLTATLGYSRIISLLLVAPPYIFMTFYSMFHSHMSDRLGNRFWFYMYPIPICIVGFIIFMTTSSFGPRYFSMFLMIFVFACNGTMYGWIGGAIPRPPAKRAAAYAFINAIGNSASIWTPFTFQTDSPNFRPALGCALGLLVIAGSCGLILRILLVRQNTYLDRLENEDQELSEKDLRRLQKTADVEGIDLGAARRLQKTFRYML